jgi:Nuclease-related domain
MILKELDPFHGGDEQAFATRISADRMAYYLRRYFRRSTTVDVLNGLRIRSSGSMAHIDHLLLHAHGMLVIEREDVKGLVQIDDEGNWASLRGGQQLMLGSPITRAYVQGLLLKAFLDRRVRQKGFFDNLELDVLVVVDDEARIEWPQSGQLVEVCKRDDVYDRVTRRLEQCRLSARGPGPLTEVERRTLGSFLCLSHWPRSEFEPE